MPSPLSRAHDTLVSASVRTDIEAETLSFERPNGSTFTLTGRVFDDAEVEGDERDGKNVVQRITVHVSRSEYLAAAGVAPEQGTIITRGGTEFVVFSISRMSHFAALMADSIERTTDRADGQQIVGGR